MENQTPESAASAAKTNPLERRLALSISAAELEKNVDARLKKLAKTVKMPGFRPGKVPFGIVRQQHGFEAHEKALYELLNQAFAAEAEKAGFHVAGYPQIKEAEGEAPEGTLAFEAVFEVYPEIAVGDLSGAKIERPQLEVSKEDVDRTLETLRQQRVRFEPDAGRAAENGDRLKISFEGKKDGEPFQGGSAQDVPLVLGKKTFLDGFEQHLPGLKAGESTSFELTFPEDYFATEMAGKTVSFEVSVKEVAAPVLPGLDAEFAKEMGIADGDVDKLRAEIESNLKREVKKRIEAKLKDQVMEALLAAHPIAVPQALVHREAGRMMEKAREDMQARGFRGKEFPFKAEFFEKGAERRVTLGLICNEILDAEKIEAKPEQVRACIDEIAQTYEKPEEVVSWYYGNPEMLDGVEALVQENNLVDWVLSKAQVEDRAYGFDELMNPAPQTGAAA
jgi:trigger factor